MHLNRTRSRPWLVITSRVLVPVLVALLALVGSLAPRDAAAKAPPLATTLVEITAYAGPDLSSEPVGTLPAGAEVELTGEAAPGFIAIYVTGGVGWVPAQYLSMSNRPGIDTAQAIVDTPLLEAPMPEAGVVVTVPEGAAVILTGATVGGYNAAAYDGAGGWLDSLDIVR